MAEAKEQPESGVLNLAVLKRELGADGLAKLLQTREVLRERRIVRVTPTQLDYAKRVINEEVDKSKIAERNTAREAFRWVMLKMVRESETIRKNVLNYIAGLAGDATPSDTLCTIPGCKNPGPYASTSGLAVHQRRTHGIKGGRHERPWLPSSGPWPRKCNFPGCKRKELLKNPQAYAAHFKAHSK